MIGIVLAAVLKVGYILICKVIVVIIFVVLAIQYWVGEDIRKAEEEKRGTWLFTLGFIGLTVLTMLAANIPGQVQRDQYLYLTKEHTEQLEKVLLREATADSERCIQWYEKQMLGIRNNKALGNPAMQTEDERQYKNRIDGKEVYRDPDTCTLRVKELKDGSTKDSVLINGPVGEIIAMRERIFYIDMEDHNVLKSVTYDGRKRKTWTKDPVKQFAVIGEYVICCTEDEKLIRCDMSTGKRKELADHIQYFFAGAKLYAQKGSKIVSVTSVGGMDYVNAQSAQQMAEVFPYILTSGVLKDVVAEDMGLDSMPGSIDVKADDGTNLLTISVSGNDPQMAYKTLKSVIKNYPKVAEFVLGETKLTILDETGIPTDTKRVEVIRGSYKRGALKGAIIGCVILLLYVLSRRTVKSRKDLKKNINLQDLGSIPYVRTKKRKKETFYNSVSLLNERISMSYLEAIRKLRIRIMKDVEKKEYQTLLVTSSIPGEGKTTLSANLAISIAQQGKKVLLVDCDLRNPSIAGVMNEQEPHPGLGSVLKKEVPLSEAITNVKLPKERTNENGSLHVIFGGAPDRENSLLIGSGRMRALIKDPKSKYDIIILDTAPSELLADAPLLGKYVDAALYVIRYDYTKLREIREGVESLALSGIDMLGYVFNGDNSYGGQGYGYGYRRYGNYGSYGSHYGSYGKYGAYGHYGKMEKGSTDKFGRVIKD